MFDLDGFKAYNDTYGHTTGDALLERLGDKLAGHDGRPRATYRMGGDEFCVLAPGRPHDAPETSSARRRRCRTAATASRQRLVRMGPLPDERARDPSAALRIADRRMYAQKNRPRASAGGQTVDVLLKVLSERSADLGTHLDDVTGLCRAVARWLGAPRTSGRCCRRRRCTTSARRRSRTRSSTSRAR